jgi:GxxExxY protein
MNLNCEAFPSNGKPNFKSDTRMLSLKANGVDLIVEDQVIVELKSLTRLPEVAVAQTLSYLKCTSLKRALLLNFGERRLVDGIKRLSL